MTPNMPVAFWSNAENYNRTRAFHIAIVKAEEFGFGWILFDFILFELNCTSSNSQRTFWRVRTFKHRYIVRLNK